MLSGCCRERLSSVRRCWKQLRNSFSSAFPSAATSYPRHYPSSSSRSSRRHPAQQSVVLSRLKCGRTRVDTNLPTTEAHAPVHSPASVPELKKCGVAPSGAAEACCVRADRTCHGGNPWSHNAGHNEPHGHAQRVGPAVRIIRAGAFANSRLTGLDLSKATSLVEIRDCAFSATNLEGRNRAFLCGENTGHPRL